MKQVIFTALAIGFIGITPVLAQDAKSSDDKKDTKKSQEIIIKLKGEVDNKITMEIKGDKVTINGKPLSEFKDDNITINRRNITVWDRNGNKTLEINPGEYLNGIRMWGEGFDKPHAFLGVTTDENEAGAKIAEVSKGNAAEKAGLKEGDIITRLGDKKIEGPESLSEAVLALKPKDEVTVYYKRDGKENSTKVTLGEKKGMGMNYSFSAPKITQGKPYPPDVEVIAPFAKQYRADNYEFQGSMFPRHQKLGLKIQDTEDGNGVKVLSVDSDSPAEKAGLKKDDIVIAVAGKKINNTDEAREELQENQAKAAYTIKAKRNGSEMNFEIKIPKKLKTANL